MLSADFYPTPKALIKRMLKGIEMDGRTYILEPSAGKGDICDYIKEHRYELSPYRNGMPHMDVIELDTDLQHVLIGKEYNLIHDDFLTFDTQRAYDLIIANFPFSDGDAHLQRALALLERTGGALVCLVNAETIRNPYTTLRQSVVNTLKNTGAEIEYIADAFTTAERPTGVEVALIRVTFQRPSPPSIVLTELRSAEPEVRSAEERSQVVDANPISALVARYTLEARAGVRLIDEYFSLLPYIAEKPSRSMDGEALKPDGIITLRIGDGRNVTSVRNPAEGVNGYLEALREKYWSLLLRNDNFTGAYTSNVLDELERRMDELKQADFTLFNIRKLEAELRLRIRSGVEKAILDLFDKLTHRFWYGDGENGNIHYFNGWKTNKAHKINERVVIPENGIAAYGDGLDYRIRGTLEDMVKVFRYLEQDDVDPAAVVSGADWAAKRNGSFRNLDFRYFTATFFKKRTCHIRFTNPKLLEKFNIFGSQRRGWLPPSYGKKTYRDMDTEERAVVDAFQGEEAYAQVVAKPDYYLVSDSSLLLAAGSLSGEPDTSSDA